MGQLEKEVLVSGVGRLLSMPLNRTRAARQIPLERSGAVCSADDEVYCACGEQIIRLDARTLLPKAVFCGGPGMNDLKVSQDLSALYALCSEGDSILMIDLISGIPVLLNRAGVNPRNMVIDGGMLAVAGGESGEVYLLCERSLCMLDHLAMPGPVYAVAMRDGRIYALCLTASLDCILVTIAGCTRSEYSLSGLPGCLFAGKKALYAATEGMLYTVSLDGTQILGVCTAPGRASWMNEADGKLLLLDAYSEGLFCRERAGWRLLCRNAAFAALSGE